MILRQINDLRMYVSEIDEQIAGTIIVSSHLRKGFGKLRDASSYLFIVERRVAED